MTRKVNIIAISAALIAVVLASAALASGQTYVDKRRVVRAGVLDLSWTNTITGAAVRVDQAAPYIFYIMGMRDDLKPYGWTFVNPLAAGADTFKNAAAYWLVPLQQTTLENLSKFDVLYMSAKQFVGFPMSERDKLRRFVDQGGCLWVDNGGGMTFVDANDPINYPVFSFFLPAVNFSSVTLTGPQTAMAKLHPLLTNPFWLTPQEISSLGISRGGMYAVNPGFTVMPPPPTILSPVVVINDDMPTIAAVEYGSGRVVLTSGFIGGKIEGPVTNWSQPAYLTSQNSNLLMASAADLRFAYNVVGWATSYTTFRKNYRRTGVSLESVGAPLVEKWRFGGAGAPGGGLGGIESSPVVWKNVIYSSSGQTLYALDAVPEQDLDMDGNRDDGLPDPPGSGVDVIWRADIGMAISSPTVASMLDPEGGTLAPKDFVLVNASDGLVYIFEALPVAPNGLLSPAPMPRPGLWRGNPMGGGNALLPPVVQNGWIYQVSGAGVVSAYSPVLNAYNGHTGWRCSLGGPAETVTVKSGPIFGYIKSQTKGALVQAISVVALRNTLNNMISNNDSICMLPVFVSSDRLQPVTNLAAAAAGLGVVKYRTSFPQIPIAQYPEPEVWAVDVAGNPVGVELASQPDIAQGTVDIRATGGALGPSTRVYMTYALDYSMVMVNSFIPPSYEIPPKMGLVNNASYQFEVGATPALGPNDSFYFGSNLASGTPGGTGVGSVCSAWFDGITSRLKWSYFLHGGGWEGVISDPTNSPAGGWGKWGIYCRLPPDNQTIVPVNSLDVRTTPAVTNDKVFVTASRMNPLPDGASNGHLLCFKADPSFQIRLSKPLLDEATGRRFSVKVWQPDLLFPAGGGALPPLLAAANVPSDMIDYQTGTITVTDFNRMRLQGSVANAATSTLTSSLPVWVFVDNQPVSPNEIDLSSWNNLVWSFALYHPSPNPGGMPRPCSGISCSPVVLGDYVYFTCVDDYLVAVAADATPMDPDYRLLLSGDPLDPKTQSEWLARVPMQDPIGQGGAGAPLGGPRVSLAGSGGIVAVPSSQGLSVFTNTLTLVADNHRVLEVGGDGRVAWACDSVYEPKEATGVSLTTVGAVQYGMQPQALNRPVVAQKFGPSDYLIVDSGSDRVIRIDRGGQVMWSLKDFVDPQDRLRSGEPLSLSAPSDARAWAELELRSGNWYYIHHCLVVDSGNFRIIDIIDRYNATPSGQVLGPANPDPADPSRPLHEVNWVSYTSYKDKRFKFTSAQLVRGIRDAAMGPQQDYIWASVSNYGLGTASDPTIAESTGGGQLGGAIISMPYRRSTGDFTWEYLPGEVAQQLTTLMDGGTTIQLSGPKYFAVLDVAGPQLLICDSSAVYVTTGANVKWKLTEEMYRSLRREIVDSTTKAKVPNATIQSPFTPQRAQMLPDGHRMIIVNSYAGRTYDERMPKFTGEIFEVDSNEPGTITSYAPEMWLYPADNLIVQQMRNAPNFDQPTCAQRLF
ncbi:MAG: DUF4159 domain-containing protein [Armatimonadetes bacterium]|nr:DUF4159 domain-containing protein [Armatimonadota bacterium]